MNLKTPPDPDIESLLNDFVTKIGTADGAYAARGRIVAAFASARAESAQVVPSVPVAWRWRWASDGHWKPLGMNASTEAGRADFIRDQEKIAPVVVEALGVIAAPSINAR